MTCFLSVGSALSVEDLALRGDLCLCGSTLGALVELLLQHSYAHSLRVSVPTAEPCLRYRVRPGVCSCLGVSGVCGAQLFFMQRCSGSLWF